MKIETLDFNGDSNIGLYGLKINNTLALGNGITDKHDKIIENILKLKINRYSIAGTDFIGVFAVYINNKLLLPHITFESEIKQFEKAGFNPVVIKSDNTCLGNSIIDVGDKILVASYMEDSAIKQISKVTEKKVEKLDIGDYPNIGSTLIINNAKAIASNSYNQQQREILEKKLTQEIEYVSVSMGSPYLKSGIMHSENGLLISKISGGPELSAIERGLNDTDK